tara:strand:- start:62 stop:163 length:102 start_codon:yes stop_codon:yes gene_type:complete
MGMEWLEAERGAGGALAIVGSGAPVKGLMAAKP